MKPIVECCVGRDVHRATVVACLNNGPADKRSSKEIRTFGTAGHDLRALIEGEQSPVDMAQLARGRMRRKQPEIARALDGHIDEHHRFILRLQLERITAAEADLAQLDERLREASRCRDAPQARPKRYARNARTSSKNRSSRSWCTQCPAPSTPSTRALWKYPSRSSAAGLVAQLSLP